MIRTLLVDEQKVIREGLRVLLESESEIEVVAAVSNGYAAIAKIEETKPDVLFITLQISDEDELDVLAIIRNKYPDLKIVVFSDRADEHHLVQSLEIGVKGYLLKESPMEEIVVAIRGVAKGYTHIANGAFSQAIPKLAETLKQFDQFDPELIYSDISDISDYQEAWSQPREQEELEEQDKQIEPIAADTFSGYGSSIASSYVEESNVPSNRSNRSAQQPLLIPGESPNKYNNLPVDRSLEGESPTGSGNRYFPMIVVASLGLLAASIGILSVISRNKPQIAIQDAVINGRTIAINSPLMGKLTKVNYSRGMAVDKDAVIAVVEPAASTNVNQAQIREQIRLKQQQKTLAQQSLDFLERSLKSLEQSVIAQSFESITPLLESLHQNQINYQEIAVKTARIREDAAKSSYESLKKLLEEGKIPQSQLDSAKSSWELAKLAIEEINANLSGIRQEYSLLKQQIANSKQQQGSTISAQTSLLKQQSSTQKLNLELLDEELGELEENLAQAVADTAQSRQITLRAPVAGSFHSQNYLAGEVVEALGTIATIVDCKNLWIEAVVDPQVTAKISPEQTVLVSVGQENLTLEGQISRVESLNSRSVINSSRQTAITTQAPQSLQSKNYSRVVVSLPDEVNQLSDQEYCGVGQTATLSISGDRGSLANNWYPQWLAEIFSGT